MLSAKGTDFLAEAAAVTPSERPFVNSNSFLDRFPQPAHSSQWR